MAAETIMSENREALSDREMQIALRFSKGEHYRDIADRLFISPATVRTHLRSIYRKLGISSKLQLRDELEVVTGNPSRQGRATAADTDIKPVVQVEEFEHSGDAGPAALLADDFRTALIDALSRQAGLRFADPVAHSLSPDFVLKGRLRFFGERCRIYLSIVVARSGEAFWTEKLDESVTDQLEFLDRVTEKISVTLRAHFNAHGGAAYEMMPDEELSVQQLLSKAAFHIYRFDAEHAVRSRRVMEAAYIRAPENPTVLAMYSYALMQTVPLALARVNEVDADRAAVLAQKAVSLGPDIDFVHHNRAKLRLWLQRDFAGCRSDADHILTINPAYHFAQEDLACAEIFSGNRREGLKALEDLVARVPRDAVNPFRLSLAAIGYALEGEMEAALRSARGGYEAKPFVPIHAIAYAVAASSDRSVTSSPEFQSMVRQHGLSPGDADRFPLADQRDRDRLSHLLQNAGI